MKANNEKWFWYWINERHQIYLKKEAKKPWPWTKDEILQTGYFTNVFRHLDRDSIWLIKNLLEPNQHMKTWQKLMTCAFFRLFSVDVMAEIGFVKRYDIERFMKICESVRQSGKNVHPRAYMLGQGAEQKGMKKYEYMLKNSLHVLYENRTELVKAIKTNRQYELFDAMYKLKGWGGWGFLAYEVVSDMTYCDELCDSDDRLTWANPGVGCRRGIARVAYGLTYPEKIHGRLKPADCIEYMQYLLKHSEKKTGSHVPSMTMRDIEHSLCEVDKYLRVKTGTGKMKRRYRYVSECA